MEMKLKARLALHSPRPRGRSPLRAAKRKISKRKSLYPLPTSSEHVIEQSNQSKVETIIRGRSRVSRETVNSKISSRSSSASEGVKDFTNPFNSGYSSTSSLASIKRLELERLNENKTPKPNAKILRGGIEDFTIMPSLMRGVRIRITCLFCV